MQNTEIDAQMKAKAVEKIRPIGMYVLVERLEHVVDSINGIAIPDNYGEKNYYVRVLKKGKGMTYSNGEKKPSTIANPGDIVVLRAFEGKKAVVYAKDLLLVDGDRIEAVARKQPWSTVNAKPAAEAQSA